MIRGLLGSIFQLRANYSNPLSRQRAQSLVVICAGIIALTGVLGVIFVLNIVFGVTDGFIPEHYLNYAAFVVIGMVYVLVQRGNLRAGSILMTIFAIIVAVVLLLQDMTSFNTMLITLPLITSSLLLRWPAVIISALILIATATLTVLTQEPVIAPDGENLLLAAYNTVIVGVMVMTLILLAFGNSLQEVTGILVRDMRGLRGLATLLNLAGVDTTEREVVAKAINSARDTLSFDLIQVYLTDGSDRLVRRYGSSLNSTQVLIDDNISISAGSLLNKAVRERQSLFLDHSKGTPVERSHLISGANVAFAAPIIFRGDVLGVVDAQREGNRVVSTGEQQALELVAMQLGSALAQARIINELRDNVADQQRIIEQQRNRLRALERAERENVVGAWVSYMEERGSGVVGFDLPSLTEDPVLSTDLLPELEAALNTGDITVEVRGDMQYVSVPILLRDQLLGAMSFKVPVGKQAIGARQQELIRSVVQRLGLALENKRLFEQSQAQALRESKANEVGSTLLSTTDIETVLRRAASNFNEALGAIQTRIHLQPDTNQSTEETA